MRSYLSGAAIGVLASLTATAALAEAPAPEESVVGISEVIVTAQRKEESAQKVGLALSVVSGQDLANKNVSNVNDLENIAPNLEIDSAYGGGQPQFRLRGVGFKDYAANNSSTVGVYVDEVAYPYASMTQGLLFDVARVEVLRGPQGTLYGRNTTGGAVNVISAKPTDTFSAGLTAEYGRFDAAKVEGYISGPLAPGLKGRLAAVTDQGGAWQVNRDTGQKLGDADSTAVRGQLEWDAAKDLTINLTGHWAKDQSDGLGLVLVAPFQARSPYAAVGTAGKLYPADTDHRITGWSLSPALAAIAGVSPDSKPFRDNESYGASINAKWDAGPVRLTSVTAYEYLKRREYNDWDGTASREADTFFHNRIEVWSQEVRLNSTTASPLQWLAGAYYSNEHVKGGFESDFSDAYRPGFLTFTEYGQSAEALGLFGQLSYALNDRFKLVGGLRYEDETRKLKDFYTRLSTAAAPTSPPYSTSTDLSEVTGKLGLEYTPRDNILIYANAARGVKSGGFTTYNKGSVSDDQLAPFKPEELWAYETGFKSDWVNGRVRLNGSIFYYDYKNQQVQASVVSPQYGVIGKLVNAPKSHIWGGELELQWELAPGLLLSQSLGYKQGEYDEFSSVNNSATRAARDPVTGLYNTVVYANRAGERLPFPRVDWSGALTYGWEAGGWDFQADVNYTYRSDLYSTTTASVIDAYWLANANFNFGKADGPWRVGVWARNLFDQYYEETRNQFTNAATASPHEPRTYGVRVSLKY